eukprot:6172996-Pleurochrysis_carterae.AAC.4
MHRRRVSFGAEERRVHGSLRFRRAKRNQPQASLALASVEREVMNAVQVYCTFPKRNGKLSSAFFMRRARSALQVISPTAAHVLHKARPADMSGEHAQPELGVEPKRVLRAVGVAHVHYESSRGEVLQRKESAYSTCLRNTIRMRDGAKLQRILQSIQNCHASRMGMEVCGRCMLKTSIVQMRGVVRTLIVHLGDTRQTKAAFTQRS